MGSVSGPAHRRDRRERLRQEHPARLLAESSRRAPDPLCAIKLSPQEQRAAARAAARARARAAADDGKGALVVHVAQDVLGTLAEETLALGEYVRLSSLASGTAEAEVWRWIGWQASSSAEEEEANGQDEADDEAEVARKEDDEAEALEADGVVDFYGSSAPSRPVCDLSSGQQLRLAALALARRPRVLLVDEPAITTSVSMLESA